MSLPSLSQVTQRTLRQLILPLWRSIAEWDMCLRRLPNTLLHRALSLGSVSTPHLMNLHSVNLASMQKVAIRQCLKFERANGPLLSELRSTLISGDPHLWKLSVDAVTSSHSQMTIRALP